MLITCWSGKSQLFDIIVFLNTCRQFDSRRLHHYLLIISNCYLFSVHSVNFIGTKSTRPHQTRNDKTLRKKDAKGFSRCAWSKAWKGIKNWKSILFIDEFHTIVGAGATHGGAMDASNLIKPALTSGKIRCIGSSTYHEYKNCVLKDRALARRFQKIDINEPTISETIADLWQLFTVLVQLVAKKFKKNSGPVFLVDFLNL